MHNNSSLRTTTLAVLFTTGLFAYHFQASAQGLGVGPTKIFYNAAPGESQTQVLRLTNNDKVKKKYSVIVQDWNRMEDGSKRYYPAGTQVGSCSDWLVVSPNIVEVNPGETKTVSVVINRPKNDPGGSTSWSVLFVEPAEENKWDQKVEDLTARININYRIAVLVYQTPPTLSEKKIDIVSLKRDPEDTKRLLLEVKNSGRILVDANLEYELLNMESGEQIPMSKNSISVLPGDRRIRKIDLPSTLVPGSYNLVAIMDYGDENDIKASEIEFTIQ